MNSFLVNYFPALLAVLMAVMTTFNATIQNLVATHPAIAAVLAAIYAIIAHMLPGSPLPGSAKQRQG